MRTSCENTIAQKEHKLVLIGTFIVIDVSKKECILDMFMNCLLITNPVENKDHEILSFLASHHIEYDTASDSMMAIQKAHQNMFDVVVLNAEKTESQIERAIRILKQCNPKVRILVRTDTNSRELESKIRQENIFYYHLNSFGDNEFTVALGSALELAKGVK